MDGIRRCAGSCCDDTAGGRTGDRDAATQGGFLAYASELEKRIRPHLRRRYGWPGVILDSFAGANAPTVPRGNPGDSTAFFLNDKTAPPVRRVAVAGFSASSTQMNTLLVTEFVEQFPLSGRPLVRPRFRRNEDLDRGLSDRPDFRFRDRGGVDGARSSWS